MQPKGVLLDLAGVSPMAEVKIGDLVQVLRPRSTEVEYTARVVGFDQAAILVVPDRDNLPEDCVVVEASSLSANEPLRTR
jgi:hypothetical protein